MRIHFGKWKGFNIEDIPEDYLEWLLDQDWLKPNLRAAIEDYLDNESSEKDPPPRPSSQQTNNQLFIDIIKLGYRELVKKNHSDVGGDTKKMMQINAAYEKLKFLLSIK